MKNEAVADAFQRALHDGSEFIIPSTLTRFTTTLTEMWLKFMTEPLPDFIG